jgi:DNA replication protein
MTYYEQYKKNVVLPQAFLTHLLDIFPTLESFNVWLYFYSNDLLAPSEVATFLKLTTEEVRQTLDSLIAAKTMTIEHDEINVRFDTRPAFAKLDTVLEGLANQKSDSENDASVPDISRLIAAFESEMLGGLTPINIEELQEWLTNDKFEVDLILQALREASLQRKVSLSYVRGILRNWQNDGIMTAKDNVNHRDARELQQKNSEVTPTAIPEEFFDSVDTLRTAWGFDRAE